MGAACICIKTIPATARCGFACYCSRRRGHVMLQPFLLVSSGALDNCLELYSALVAYEPLCLHIVIRMNSHIVNCRLISTVYTSRTYYAALTHHGGK